MTDIEASYQEYAARQVQQLIQQDKVIYNLRAEIERLRARIKKLEDDIDCAAEHMLGEDN